MHIAGADLRGALFGVGRLLDGGGTALAGLHEELATQEREEAIAALLRDAEQARR